MIIDLPLFIAFEGIDGSGKSTIANCVYDHLEARGLPAVKMMEPTGGNWGKMIREKLKGSNMPPVDELLELFLKDREEDVSRNILPALKKNKIVLIDRYFYSNAAYQGAMGISPDKILDENLKRNFPVPDRVYLIDIEAGEALKRISGRDGSREIFEKEKFLETVRQLFLSMANEKFCIIDGSGSIERITDEIIRDLRETFGKK